MKLSETIPWILAIVTSLAMYPLLRIWTAALIPTLILHVCPGGWGSFIVFEIP